MVPTNELMIGRSKMELEISISIPYLWGAQEFRKRDWGYVNFLVGSNGSGKTLFADQLKAQCVDKGFKTRYLNAERLAGLERQNYGNFGYSQLERGFNTGDYGSYKNQGKNYGLSSDAFVLLRQKLDAKIRIEATLSQLFGRRIKLTEVGGFLKPMVQKINGGDEYRLKENECHGLKELITLLTIINDDEYNCLIIDEPELHLHPQFQMLLLQEIRRISGDPRVDSHKKCFFLITHSPYFIDLRTTEDLKNCIIFQPDKLPTYIDHLDSDDERRISRLLLRLNTHHKQFFFSPNPIFVEGYTDQQWFSLIEERRGKILGASGACIIDVNGKDELDMFFRLCNNLNINCKIIADLDAIFKGKLRRSVSDDERCRAFIQKEGLGLNLLDLIGKIEREIGKCLLALDPILKTASLDSDMLQFSQAINDASDLENKRYIFCLGLKLIKDKIKNLIRGEEQANLTLIEGGMQKIFEGFKQCGVYLLSRGQLENYFISYTGSKYKIPDNIKTDAFLKEREIILSPTLTEHELKSNYPEILDILDHISHTKNINLDLYISYSIGDLIHKVQSGFSRGEIYNSETFKKNGTLDWEAYSRIIDLIEFSVDDSKFLCRIKLKPIIDLREREIAFSDEIVPAAFRLEKE